MFFLACWTAALLFFPLLPLICADIRQRIDCNTPWATTPSEAPSGRVSACFFAFAIPARLLPCPRSPPSPSPLLPFPAQVSMSHPTMSARASRPRQSGPRRRYGVMPSHAWLATLALTQRTGIPSIDTCLLCNSCPGLDVTIRIPHCAGTMRA